MGDAVLGTVSPGWGGFAEHTLLRADTAVAKPEEISFTGASTIPVAAATAYDGTHQIELEAGQTLLTLGIGGGVAPLMGEPRRHLRSNCPGSRSISIGPPASTCHDERHG